VNKQYVARDIIVIDREVYEHLGPLHQATADLLVAKGKCRVEDKDRNPSPHRGAVS
jgi:hypothetical protein